MGPILVSDRSIFRFDGMNFKNELSSNHNHQFVYALGNYKGSPFVTGHDGKNGFQTEILDYSENRWDQEEDYPFSPGYR